MKERPATPRLSAIALIAPCGMNCGLCHAFLRPRNRCPGCRGDDREKRPTCVRCKIKTCRARDISRKDFCTSCARFPCEALVHLDKRYRAKYGMSMIENLQRIDAEGLPAFVANEKLKWACPGCGATLCVHRPGCLTCQRPWR